MELASSLSRISTLEASLRTLKKERDDLFEQSQLRQAELESSQSHIEALENEVSDLRHQVREANDRILSVNEELSLIHI